MRNCTDIVRELVHSEVSTRPRFTESRITSSLKIGDNHVGIRTDWYLGGDRLNHLDCKEPVSVERVIHRSKPWDRAYSTGEELRRPNRFTARLQSRYRDGLMLHERQIAPLTKIVVFSAHDIPSTAREMGVDALGDAGPVA